LPGAAYAGICCSALLPLAIEAQSGDLLRVGTALGAALGGIGGNLIANQLQRFRDHAAGAVDLADSLQEWLVKEIPKNIALRQELDTLLEKLDVIAEARRSIPVSDHQEFVGRLSEELTRLGNLNRFEAHLHAPGAIAQGAGATAITLVAGRDINLRGVYEGPSTDRPRDAIQIYRRVLAANARRLPMRGIDVTSSDPTEQREAPDLARVYISLDSKSLSSNRSFARLSAASVVARTPSLDFHAPASD
jgi:hypothetical protein